MEKRNTYNHIITSERRSMEKLSLSMNPFSTNIWKLEIFANTVYPWKMGHEEPSYLFLMTKYSFSEWLAYPFMVFRRNKDQTGPVC